MLNFFRGEDLLTPTISPSKHPWIKKFEISTDHLDTTGPIVNNVSSSSPIGSPHPRRLHERLQPRPRETNPHPLPAHRILKPRSPTKCPRHSQPRLNRRADARPSSSEPRHTARRNLFHRPPTLGPVHQRPYQPRKAAAREGLGGYGPRRPVAQPRGQRVGGGSA